MTKVSIGACNPDAGSSKMNKTGDWRIMRPEVDYDKCTKKCWFCFEFCPDSSIKKTDNGPEIDYVFCKGCGICAYECPKEAIRMEEEEK
jgi:pyruvate ferredoxin oxidoreductase delta subunit